MLNLYSVYGGPPSLACKMALVHLNVPHKIIFVDFNDGEHLTEKFGEMNPQYEIPILDDDGFFLGESNAILQYIGDKFDSEGEVYPKDPQQRALINHRLCFYNGIYYASICMHFVAPIYFDYPRNQQTEKRMLAAVALFEKYLSKTGTKYAAGEKVSLADFPLMVATMCLDVIGFDLTKFPLIKKWYDTFKQEHPMVYDVAFREMDEIADGYKNPPTLTMKSHPVHPLRK